MDNINKLRDLPKSFWKLFSVSGIGWAFDAMDVIIIGSVIAALKQEWANNPEELAMIPNIVSVGFLGMAIGAAFGGRLADKYGRKPVFATTLLIFGIASGLSAIAWTSTILILLRFFVGLGLGAELPVASTLVSEESPAKLRGRIIVLLESFWALGALLAALIGAFIVPLSIKFGADTNLISGWRIALLIGAVPAIWGVYIRRGVQESSSFLELQNSKSDTNNLELKNSRKGNFKKLWNSENRARTISIWITWFAVTFAYYGAFTWMPTLLVSRGFDLTKSLMYTLIVTLFQLPGYFLAAFLIEKLGRKITLPLFLIGAGAFAVAFGFAVDETQILVFGSLLSLFNLGAWGALYAVTPEIYSVDIRGTGSGSAAAFGRVASIICPYIVVWTSNIENIGFELTFIIFSIVFVLGAISAATLPDKTSQKLE